jgi:PEP-CTERM motif-containing protein
MTFLRSSTRRSQWPGALVIIGGILGITRQASAGPITTDIWWQFAFSDPGVLATGCDPADPAGPFCIPSGGTPTSFINAPPWTITVPAGGALLTVTDAFSSGDRFQIFDFGMSLGLTSLPAAAGVVNCGADPVPCLAAMGISHGVFGLATGNHSLTLVPTASVTGGGSGYLQVAVVPEPATMLLVGTGLCLAGLRRARTRR